MHSDTELVVHPVTGEAVDLASAPDALLGRFLADVRDYESRLREAKGIVSREALRRMDESASWTMKTGLYTLRGSSPAAGEDWDELALYADLWKLVDDGVISESAADAAIGTAVTYKVRKAGINALRRLGGRVAETVNRHSRPAEKQRYVSVSQTGPVVG